MKIFEKISGNFKPVVLTGSDYWKDDAKKAPIKPVRLLNVQDPLWW